MARSSLKRKRGNATRRYSGPHLANYPITPLPHDLDRQLTRHQSRRTQMAMSAADASRLKGTPKARCSRQ